jgi:hypothetical protein
MAAWSRLRSGRHQARLHMHPPCFLSLSIELAILMPGWTPPPAVEPLITVRRPARAVGIDRHLLFQAAERGELAIFDAGGWRLSDVKAWLERTRRALLIQLASRQA